MVEDFAVSSPNNPDAVNGEIDVDVGDRLPLVPEQLLKAGLRIVATEKLTVGGDLVASGGSHFRGDEANLVDEIGGYAVLGLRAEYAVNDHARLFLNVDNVLDEEYETFGVLGEATDVLGAAFDDPRFVGPGAPRAAWIGVRVSF